MPIPAIIAGAGGLGRAALQVALALGPLLFSSAAKQAPRASRAAARLRLAKVPKGVRDPVIKTAKGVNKVNRFLGSHALSTATMIPMFAGADYLIQKATGGGEGGEGVRANPFDSFAELENERSEISNRRHNLYR